jgi:hypothetical protein
MKIIGRLFLVFIITLALIMGTCPISLGSDEERSGSSTGEKAYIFIGDVNPPWYSLLLRSSFGEVDPYKELQPVIEAQKKKLEAMGYTVTIQSIAIESDLKSALQDPATKAVAWFGHGDEGIPGTIYTAHEEETITPGDIAEWSREQLANEVGTPDTWKGLPDPERKELMKRWNDAHFNLEYAYFHTCYGMKNNDLVDVLMADDGQFYGYSGTAGISDTSEKATSIRGNPAKEQGSSGIVPTMPMVEIEVKESMLTASSTYNGYTPLTSFDTDLSQNSGWSAAGGEKNGWIVVDFGTVKNITRIEVIPDRYSASAPSYSYLDRFRIDAWIDNSWHPMSSLISTPDESWYEVPLKASTDKIRIWAESDGNGPQIKGIKIYE